MEIILQVYIEYARTHTQYSYRKYENSDLNVNSHLFHDKLAHIILLTIKCA